MQNVKRLIVYILLVIPIYIFAQTGKSYYVKDVITGEPVPFANIVLQPDKTGTVSQIDGSFRLTSDAHFTRLEISCMGYKMRQIDADSLSEIVLMQPLHFEIPEVKVIPQMNPALQIMQRVYNNRQRNNPDLATSYSCLIYHKMTFGMALPDTIDGNNEELKRLYDFNKNNYLLLLESVSEKKNQPPNLSNERIISGRVSGFKDPTLAILPSQIQPFTFYNEKLELLSAIVTNPISKTGLKEYIFQLKDTLIEASGDTIFYITFEPKQKSRIKGLQGSMHIHTPSYGIKTISATTLQHQTPYILSIRQNYVRYNNKYWFPEQLETHLTLTQKINGKPLPFPLIGEGKSIVTAINLNLKFNIDDFSRLSLIDESHQPTAPAIASFRKTALTHKDSVTYIKMDSIGQKLKFDKLISLQKNLIQEQLPFGIFNIDLNHVLDYNNYEGLKIGLGLETNEKISNKISSGGFYMRSLRSTHNNYGGHIKLFFSRIKEQSLKIAYSNELKETGQFRFLDGFDQLSNERYRRFSVEIMDKTKTYETSFTTRILLNLKTRFTINYETVTPVMPYPYTLDQSLNEAFCQYESTLQIKYQPSLQLASTGFGLLPRGGIYPAFWGNISAGSIDNKYYQKTEFQAEHQTKITNTIKMAARITAGHLSGTVNPTQLYSAFGSYSKLGLETKYSFATIRPAEFGASSFALLFLRATIPTNQNQLCQFKPEINLSTSAGWGHADTPTRTFSKGLYETGIYIENLLKQNFIKYGIAVHYRYGPYQLPTFHDNIAIKIGLEIGL
ncbi:DUF5686 family protein [Geofilum sp. OHC36d9]|uniref:DUF5686 family protein n=1 Tax=Geofilum sp. OHC36d9 TaxID=3458413 RepID=UPI0040343445